MTIDVSDNNPRINYSIAEGVTQTVFSVPFEFFEDSNVYIYVDGVLKTEGLDYTLTGGDGSTGTLTFVTATPPDVQQVTGASGGSVVTLVRHVSLERVTDFVAGQDINRAALNEQLDTIVAQVADLDNKVDRTIHLSDSEVAPSMLLTSDRKGRVLAFNSTTGDVEAGPLSNDIATIADNIAEILAADDEAAAAAASATSAANSATSAQTAQTAAELAETNAETAETNAAASAVTAASEATTATTKASEAAASASNAATSESNAASSATAAADSATTASAASDAALAALDSFDDRYLGQKASDPTVDNDGDPLVAGALYFNTTDSAMKVYEGSTWVAAYASLSGALLANNNLSDLADAAVSRTNLGLATVAATGAYSDLSGTPSLATVATTGAYSDLTGIPAGYGDADVDTHLNTGTATTGEYLSWNGSDYDWATVPAGYADADVDTHLNTGTATTDQVLAWTGSDYDWVDASAGATGGGTDKIFVENGQVVTTNYTVSATTNAMTTGPIDINAGVTVTVETGGRWVVI